MSELNIWVCNTSTNAKEILRVYGNNRPSSALCKTPIDPDTGAQVATLSYLDLRYFYTIPESETQVTLDAENSDIPTYYKRKTTNTWHTPVPNPIPEYWDDNGTWKDASVNVPPEGTTKFVASLNVPARQVEALINETAKVDHVAQELVRLKSAKSAKIEQKYKALCAEDYLWTDGKLYQVSDDLRDGLNAVNTGLYTDRPWMAKDNTLRTFTVTEFKELGKAIFDRGDLYFIVKQTKKAEVNALTTASLVNAYDVNAGWTL